MSGDDILMDYHSCLGPIDPQNEGRVAIDSLRVVGGSLPSKAVELLREWALLHREELLANWDAARRGAPLKRIAGL
jgi:hypothetical protein